MNTWDKCKNCGGERGIHHYETDQCPVGGCEAPIGRKQEYKTTVFEFEIDESDKDETIAALRARVAELKKFPLDFLDNFKTCEYCTGGLLNGDTCPRCKGTGEQIDSIGILYVDLPEKARELLGAS